MSNYVDWEMKGVEFVNCNCAWGCPCQFNGPPTHGNCRAFGFGQIDKGHFGNVPLDGLRWGILAAWPGPIHLGNGKLQTIVEERANPQQRKAIETITHGGETDRDDDGHDAAVGRAHASPVCRRHSQKSGRRAGRRPCLCVCGRLFAGLDGFQPGGDGIAASVRSTAFAFTK